MNRVWVDFNDRDRRGRVPAMVRDAADEITIGDEVTAYDGDENWCRGIVVESDGRFMSIEMKWETFVGASVSADDLIEA